MHDREPQDRPAGDRGRGRTRRLGAALALAGVALLGFGLRALGFEGVFVGDEVLLAVGDGYYHARLALYSFVNFPAILTWDPYINYPDGGAVPSPPLFAWTVAAVARLFGDEPALLERALAWAAPVAGALMTVPVYLGARRLGGRGVALGAAALAVTLPVLAGTSHVGNADHHAFQALLGATLLWLFLAAAGGALPPARLAAVGIGLALVRLAMMVSWSGSLLVVGLADGLLACVAAGQGRRRLLGVQAVSACATAAVLAPVVRALPPQPGGAYSAIGLSRLHVLFAVAVAAVTAVLWLLERWRAGRSAPIRLARLAGAATVVAAVLLAVPDVRHGLLLALRFVSEDRVADVGILELMPLLPIFGRPVSQPPEQFYGYFAYLIPLAPLAAFARARAEERRGAALFLAGWSAVLGALSIWQVRYGAEFTPGAAIAFALLLALATRPLAGLAGGPALRAAVAVAVGTVLLLPPLRYSWLPTARNTWSFLRSGERTDDLLLRHPTGSLQRFLAEVRALTPETAGFLDASQTPEYGVLCPPRIGHPLHYVARRASAADGLLHVVGPDNFAAARRFFRVRSERRALAIAERLRARYAITMHFPGIRPGTLEARLQFGGGAGADGAPPLAHFRLRTEGPRGGRPLSDLVGFPSGPGAVPYRLFEIVPGAVLEARAPEGTSVRAALLLRTPTGRRFWYRAETRADADGVARLRVPYPTDGGDGTVALGTWQVLVGDAAHALRVREDEVREGATVRIPEPPRR